MKNNEAFLYPIWGEKQNWHSDESTIPSILSCGYYSHPSSPINLNKFLESPFLVGCYLGGISLLGNPLGSIPLSYLSNYGNRQGRFLLECIPSLNCIPSPPSEVYPGITPTLCLVDGGFKELDFPIFKPIFSFSPILIRENSMVFDASTLPPSATQIYSKSFTKSFTKSVTFDSMVEGCFGC